MSCMFAGARSFQGDISKWNVSRVTDMTGMFKSAVLFNGDISQWDVSRVAKMDHMFMNADSFKRQLCGDTWVHSEASKTDMFADSPGSISETVCRASSPQRWLARWQVASTSVATPVTTQGVGSAIMRCPNCGTFKKSGRISCCAPGGAWYRNCGGIENRDVGHSWQEGIRVCKPQQQFRVAVVQQLHASQPQSNISFGDGSSGVGFKAAVMATQMRAPLPANSRISMSGVSPIALSAETLVATPSTTPVNRPFIDPNLSIMLQANSTLPKSKQSSSIDLPAAASTHKSSRASASTRGCENLSRVVARIGMVLVVICWR